jgi:hypothetical protein
VGRPKPSPGDLQYSNNSHFDNKVINGVGVQSEDTHLPGNRFTYSLQRPEAVDPDAQRLMD